MITNLELAKQTRELIRQFPERHGQIQWSSNAYVNPAKTCDTTACIAGWVAAAKGYTVDQIETQQDAGIDEWAGAQLGLTPTESNALFYTMSDILALKLFDEMIAEAEAAR